MWVTCRFDPGCAAGVVPRETGHGLGAAVQRGEELLQVAQLDVAETGADAASESRRPVRCHDAEHWCITSQLRDLLHRAGSTSATLPLRRNRFK